MKAKASSLYLCRTNCISFSTLECEAIGATYLVSGYGLNGNAGEATDILQYMQAQYVSEEECQLAAPFRIPSFSFCGKGTTGASTCSGDSGSALARFNLEADRWEMVGVVQTGTNVVEGQLFCSAGSEEENFDLYVSVRHEYAWLSAALRGELGDPTPTTRYEPVQPVRWFDWVPPLVGGVLVIGIFILIVLSFQKKRSNMKKVAQRAAQRPSSPSNATGTALDDTSRPNSGDPLASAYAATRDTGGVDGFMEEMPEWVI